MQDHIEVLTRLVQTDIDAVACYEQAIARVEDTSVAGVLRSFRADHERHIQELSEAIRQLGGQAPTTPDLSGRMLSGMTGLTSSMGTASALGIMEANEVVTNDAYAHALDSGLPDHLWEIVARGRDDERRHLDSIRALLGQFGARGRAMRAYGAIEGQAASAWMNTIRHHPWALLLLAGAAGVVIGTLWYRRPLLAAANRALGSHDEERLAREMAEPVDYPGYQQRPGEAGEPMLH